MQIGDRIRAIKKYAGLSSKQFGSMLGITQTTMSNIENNKHMPKIEYLVAMVNKWHISPLWLLTGKGSMFGDEPPFPADEYLADVNRWFDTFDEDRKGWFKTIFSETFPEFTNWRRTR